MLGRGLRWIEVEVVVSWRGLGAVEWARRQFGMGEVGRLGHGVGS